MKKLAIGLSVCVALLFAGTTAFAQDTSRQDNPATGGSGMGGLGAPLTGGSALGEDSYRTAVRLIHHERYADAIPYLNQALLDRPGNAGIYAYEGYAYSKVGDFANATQYLNRALATDPDHKAAHQYLGELDLMRHDLNSANAQSAELARICPDGCDERDDLTKAIADYQAKNAAPPATAAAPATPPTQH